jgi:E3 ubiquitin-protein ligase RNF115/126
MDQSNNQNAPPQSQQPAHRDMMFCHECDDEWYRDQSGLTCPACGSDFTEIVRQTTGSHFHLTIDETKRICTGIY